jgi:hypothetical protein
MPRCIPRLIYVDHTTWCAFEKVTNGKRCSKPVTTILNMLVCHLALSTHLFLSTFNEQCILWIFEWFYGCYIDDILIFSKNIKDYNDDVHLVLEKLQEVELYAKLKKCDFHQSEMEFLRYVIFGDGIHMDLRKVQTIMDYVTPISIQDVQCFLIFANFY